MSQYQDPKKPFEPDRSRLPIHEPKYRPITDREVSDNVVPDHPPRFTVAPPEGAPNVLLVLIDDMGFGCTSAFGGPVPMPTAERLAEDGIKFNRFHTTSICAPTRAALLSGYNHHSVNMGEITELGTAYPGNLSTRPKSITPVARVLRENGYSTAQFGKCHETPTWETSISGPFDHWPIHSGFDKFYGFMSAETNQFNPELIDGTKMVDLPNDPNYHLSEDLAEKCNEWIRFQKALTPDKPFFVYLAPGATHAPHHAPEAYRDMFKGQFDDGWDKMREETLEKMKKLGIVPKDTKIAPKPPGIQEWDSLPEDEKKLYARQMEIYAGYAHHVDEQVGKVVDTLEDLNILDDTLVIYILGDNGASPEGDLHGVFNEISTLNMIPEPLEYVMGRIDELGTPMSNNHYAAGWAVALDSPFTWTKTVASNFGGTRNGIIFRYPKGFEGRGEVRTQFHHVIDIAPTILDICGIEAPQEVDGVEQQPMEGVSMLDALKNANAPENRKTQYFCVGGYWGVYHEGWFAGVNDKAPWERTKEHAPVDQQKWELYNIDEDWSCSTDIADQNPEKLAEMKAIFFEEAEKYNVLPIDIRGQKTMNAKIADRPTLLGDRTEITLGPGMGGLKENCFLNMKNTSFTITAEVEVAPGHTDGVIFAQGGRFGGYSLYVKDGKPVFCFNCVSMERYYTRSEQPLKDERNQIKVDFKYDGGGYGKGGDVTLTVNNEVVATGRVEQTMGFFLSFDETANVGCQRATPVTEEYTIETSHFQGKIYSVNIKVTD